MLFGGIIAIMIISPRLSLVMISTFPVLMLVAVFIGRKVRKLSREAQDRLAESATIVEETLQGIANVKAFTNESYEVKRYLLVGQRVWNLAFSPDGKRLYTTNGVSNDMSVIDVAAQRVVKSVPVGGLPWGVVAAP